MNLHQLIDRYATGRDVTPGYVQQLRLAVAKFEGFLGRSAGLADLADDPVNRWMVALLKANLARRTVRSKRGHLLVLWRFAYAESLTNVAPRKLRQVSCPKLIPEASEPQAVARLLDVVAKIPGVFRRSRVPRAAFWTALILLTWESGLRLGDLLKLQRGQISSRGVLGVIQNKTSWPLVCQLSPECMAAIAATFPPERKRIFGDALSRGRMLIEFRKIAREAGFPGGTKRIRKSGATAVERLQPGAATAYLGHQSPTVAYQFYVDPRLAQRDKRSPPRLDRPTDAA